MRDYRPRPHQARADSRPESEIRNDVSTFPRSIYGLSETGELRIVIYLDGCREARGTFHREGKSIPVREIGRAHHFARFAYNRRDAAGERLDGAAECMGMSDKPIHCGSWIFGRLEPYFAIETGIGHLGHAHIRRSYIENE